MLKVLGHPKHEFTGAELDTLIAAVENGPVWAGDIPSKQGRDSLLRRGIGTMVVVKGEQGFYAADYAACEIYKTHFGTSVGGTCDTIAEAKANRLAAKAVNTASKN